MARAQGKGAISKTEAKSDVSKPMAGKPKNVKTGPNKRWHFAIPNGRLRNSKSRY